MKNFSITRLLTFFLLIILPLFFSCGGYSKKDQAEVEPFIEQVEKFWNAKKENNWELVYNMFEKSFRDKVDKSTFLSRTKVKVVSFKISNTEITEPRRNAVSEVDYKINQMGFEFELKATDQWIWENNEWKVKYKGSHMKI